MTDEKMILAKKEILRTLIKKLEADIVDANKQYKQTRQDIIDAPGRMQARYDSSKQEFSYIADSLHERISQLQQEVIELKKCEFVNAAQNKVSLYSLVKTKDKGRENFYFILPAGGGKTIKSQNLEEETIIITPSSPLGGVLLNKKIGDLILIGSRELIITAII